MLDDWVRLAAAYGAAATAAGIGVVSLVTGELPSVRAGAVALAISILGHAGLTMLVIRTAPEGTQ